MPQHDPRIDDYIARQAAFARPLLAHLRAVVHEACPQVEETIKWSAPSFVHAGRILCGMAAFKHHVSFGFWKHALVMGDGASGDTPSDAVPRDGMGSFGKMTSLDDVPPKRQLLAWIRKAMALNEQGVAARKRSSVPRPAPETPPDLAAALARNRRAQATFDAFPPGKRREYVDWITEAKRAETRQKRLAQAVEWLAEGKPRNWKYMRC